MFGSFPVRNNCEQEAKFIQDRIVLVEKNMAELCQTFGHYSKKMAQVRDEGDKLSKALLASAESEHINKSLSNGFENMAISISNISDYGDARVSNINTKVVQELFKYESICKHAKEEIRQIYSAKEKELKRKMHLDRIKDRNPGNRQQIVQAETNLLKATSEVSKCIQNLEEKTKAFERQKLHDLKAILLDFVTAEMSYNAKALEILTQSYRDIDAIDEESDLENFKKTLQILDTIQHNNLKSSRFTSRTLGSLGTIFAGKKTAESENDLTHSRSEMVLNPAASDKQSETEEDTSSDENTEDFSEKDENYKGNKF